MRDSSLRIVLLCALAAIGAIAVLADATAAPTHRARANVMPADYLLAKIDRHREETWRWQRLMSRPKTPAGSSARRSRDPAYRRWVLELWKSRAGEARSEAGNPPRKAAWLCIYRHERHPRQGWSTNTGNGYYGGLQMDVSFQRLYGRDLLRRKGTADNWSAIEQIWVAERAFRDGRGFYPWPNTARACGLI